MGRKTINISEATKSKLDEIKGQITYDELVNHLLRLKALKVDTRGATKAEIQLVEFLDFGHEKEITPSELRKWCGVNMNICKSVIGEYQKEVGVFNQQFNNK